MQLHRYFEVSQSPDIDALRSRLVAWTHDMGFGLVNATMVYAHAERMGQAEYISVHNAPAEYLQSCAFAADEAARDPVWQRLKRLSVPFIYDQSLYASEGAGDLWERQASYGFKTGVAVAMHLPGNRHFLLGVDRDDPLPGDEVALQRLLADLQLLAVHAQDAATRLFGSAISDAPLPALGKRELEILRWTMAGKSAWTVGQLLSISENTVNFHLRNISRKLGTASKHQSVLKAISLGLI